MDVKPGTNRRCEQLYVVCVCVWVGGCVVPPFWHRVSFFLQWAHMINTAINTQNVKSPEGC